MNALEGMTITDLVEASSRMLAAMREARANGDYAEADRVMAIQERFDDEAARRMAGLFK